jgi:GntR family transcriptional regulator
MDRIANRAREGVVVEKQLDRSTAVPLHHQVSELLRAQIASGRYRPGDMLPPETVLAAEFNLSRATVRQGIATLVQEGLLRRRRGVGTTVARPNFEQPLNALYTFHSAALRSGRDLRTVVLSQRLVPASGRVAERLRLCSPHDQVLEVERLRVLDDAPLVLECCVLPAERCALLRDADLTRPIYDLLEELCGIVVTSAHEQIRPVTLSSSEAARLGQRRGAPAFQVERVAFAGQEPIEWRRSLICGDRYLYSVDLQRPAARD